MQNTPFAEYFADLLENMGSSDMSESPLASLGDSPNEKLPIHHGVASTQNTSVFHESPSLAGSL